MRRTLRFLLPLLLCWLLATCATAPPPATATPSARHTVLLVSIDGLRADAVTADTMPTLDALARAGVRAQWMNPSYPTLTFPNHYTIVTGLRPDHHGIVHNNMHDPTLGAGAQGWFSLNDRHAVQDPRWWGGEPIWVTLQRRGGHAATMFWPGSEAAIDGMHPDHWFPYRARVTSRQRVDQVLAWLDVPPAQRPDLVTLYFDRVDTAGHDHGPSSPDYAQAARGIDGALAQLLAGLSKLGLRDGIDIVVVSDHGMAGVAAGHKLFLDDALAAAGLPPTAIDVISTGEVVGFAATPGHEAAVDRALLGRHDHYTCWRKGEMPARWHYGTNPRIPPIVCQTDVGYILLENAAASTPGHPRGAHGFAPESPEMRAVFIANGPDFVAGATLPPFDNVDVYPLLARLLGIEPRPNDGDIKPLLPALKPAPPL